MQKQDASCTQSSTADPAGSASLPRPASQATSQKTIVKVDSQNLVVCCPLMLGLLTVRLCYCFVDISFDCMSYAMSYATSVHRRAIHQTAYTPIISACFNMAA